MATLIYKKHFITSYIRPSEDHKELIEFGEFVNLNFAVLSPSDKA